MDRVLEQAYEAISEQLRGFDSATAARHPAGDENAWSARQVIEHLLATYATCTAALDARIAKGRPLETKRSFKERVMQWLIIDVGYFPPGRKAPEAVRPGKVSLGAQDGAAMDGEVRAALLRLDEALCRVAAVYPSGLVVTHFVLGPLSVRQWRKFHHVHARHHAKQLRRVKAESAVG